MNWEGVGAIGQAVSALALVIVIVQVRLARADSRRALSQGRAEGVRDLLALGTDERINRLTVNANTALEIPRSQFTSALMDRAGLTHEEANILATVQLAWWNHTLQVIPNIDSLPAVERVQFDYGVRARLGSGMGRLFYEQVKGPSHPDAVRYVESVLAGLIP